MGALTVIYYKIYLLLLLSTTSICDDFNYQLVKDYLLYSNVRIVLFATGERQTLVDVEKSRLFQNDGIWISQWNTLNEIDYERFFVRSSHQICIVINLTNNRTQNILHEVSQRKMFHFERSWIMFGTSQKQTFDLLSNENVNVDAQIATIVPIDEK